MIFAFIADLPTYAAVLLVICLVAVCLFEAINGFHDTANAVATVIYTNSLKPMVAVVWSGLWNFLGVLAGGIAVAIGILKLIPINEFMVSPLSDNISLVLAVLLAAIVWNLGTWYYGIPCSSSHTLIGALLGGGYAFWTIHANAKVNWEKAGEIGMSLLISPLFGFSLAILLMFILRSSIKKRKELFSEPKPNQVPPLWIRGILILTCTLVSFFHGSNDGQKGVGLLMVVLMAFMPLQYALNHNVPMSDLKTAALKIEASLRQPGSDSHVIAMADDARRTANLIDSTNTNDKAAVFALRKNIQSLNKELQADIKSGAIDGAAVSSVSQEIKKLKSVYEFAPTWAILLISICLGLGTMVGWKRIVVTIGEKIGKTHLTYAQGASAEICAAATIGVSTGFGLPVSTTQVLSSGIAGTMVASGGVKNLQKSTIKNIALAWILTLPVTFILGAVLFYILRMII
jgi:inorganic phosphate transporter, PiT family